MRHRHALAPGAALLALLPQLAGATDLSNNLHHARSGLETVGFARRIAASFQNSGGAATLESVTLLLGNPIPGTARVDLYQASSLEPGPYVGTLVAPASYTATPMPATFGGNGLTLAAGGTYWIVLTGGLGCL